jgi:hypothetical protein
MEMNLRKLNLTQSDPALAVGLSQSPISNANRTVTPDIPITDTDTTAQALTSDYKQASKYGSIPQFINGEYVTRKPPSNRLEKTHDLHVDEFLKGRANQQSKFNKKKLDELINEALLEVGAGEHDHESTTAQVPSQLSLSQSKEETNEVNPPRQRTEEEQAQDESSAISQHPWGLIVTVLGTVLLDFDADACQSPSRAYMLDVTLPGELFDIFS